MIEIHIQEDFIPMGVRIYVTSKIGSARSFLQPDGTTWITVEMSEYALRDEIKPTVTLPMGIAEEVLQALTRHYHGADDARMLRKDYNDERERVDTVLIRYHELAMKSIEAFEAGL